MFDEAIEQRGAIWRGVVRCGSDMATPAFILLCVVARLIQETTPVRSKALGARVVCTRER